MQPLNFIAPFYTVPIMYLYLFNCASASIHLYGLESDDKNVYSHTRLHFSFEFEAMRRVRKSSRNIEDNLGANIMIV